ncbi:hypothetical protein [Mucilaginibacter segetis]|uniref:Uncharacterized protein n=1 Tax=Mucilaginibacter segetis TaxID=2793071 RepID=A0A934PXX5_9SPHI|nr:hypothetical protein [Mucilaginibacter segetis]MBK0381170.1 hypothetical protein [Mucilaginibacter segetis]
MDSSANVYFRSKRVSLIILAVTAVVCSRLLFFFFKDPEGPNLFVVGVMALLLFVLAAAVYLLGPLKINGINRLSLVIGIQVLAAIVLYFCM